MICCWLWVLVSLCLSHLTASSACLPSAGLRPRGGERGNVFWSLRSKRIAAVLSPRAHNANTREHRKRPEPHIITHKHKDTHARTHANTHTHSNLLYQFSYSDNLGENAGSYLNTELNVYRLHENPVFFCRCFCKGNRSLSASVRSYENLSFNQ